MIFLWSFKISTQREVPVFITLKRICMASNCVPIRLNAFQRFLLKLQKYVTVSAAVLRNRNYFLRFGFHSSAVFWKVTVLVPTPTFERLQFRFWLRLMKSYSSGSGQVFRSRRVVFNQKVFVKNLAFLMYVEAVLLIKYTILSCVYENFWAYLKRFRNRNSLQFQFRPNRIMVLAPVPAKRAGS